MLVEQIVQMPSEVLFVEIGGHEDAAILPSGAEASAVDHPLAVATFDVELVAAVNAVPHRRERRQGSRHVAVVLRGLARPEVRRFCCQSMEPRSELTLG